MHWGQAYLGVGQGNVRGGIASGPHQELNNEEDDASFATPAATGIFFSCLMQLPPICSMEKAFLQCGRTIAMHSTAVLAAHMLGWLRPIFSLYDNSAFRVQQHSVPCACIHQLADWRSGCSK